MTDAGRQSEAYFRDRYSIDRATASELLGVAMSRGGDRAELFFEHREGSNLSFEQQAVKSASRSITQGLGVRVLQGEAIGYAFTEDLSREAMRRAADTAARIASRGDTAPPVDVVHYESANHYEPSASTLSVPPAEKVELIPPCRCRRAALRPVHCARGHQFHRRAQARDDRDKRRPHRR